MIGQEITLTGFAKVAKGGSVLLTQDNEVIYVKGVGFWSPDLINKQVLARGVLKKEQFLPQTTIDENGGISSGVTGKQYVLEMIEYSKVTE
jgi:hypothetical protein